MFNMGFLGVRLDQDLEEKIQARGRSGVKGRYFTFDLRDKLEDVVEGTGGVYNQNQTKQYRTK